MSTTTVLTIPIIYQSYTNYPKHLDAKIRWIIQGFHDPDIKKLQRSVPTPEMSDVLLTLQMIASLQADGILCRL